MKIKQAFALTFTLILLTIMMGVLPAAAAVIDGVTAKGQCSDLYSGAVGSEQLSPCQWNMGVINADAVPASVTGAGVKVGVIDGGVDFTHPDLAGGIDVALSCSFIFGSTPTAHPLEIANGDCSNKEAVQDRQGHATHVSTIIAGRVNGIGIAGVAPKATIVALKACTFEGFCFADSVAAALRYAGDQRLDVVNLSLFADPFLYFCANEAEQRAVLLDLQKAARYAQQRGVVIVAAAGNQSHDLGHPTSDEISPDWPPNTAIEREVRNNCRVTPAELPGVVTVSATDLNGLAGYSNVGSPVDVTAPGGKAFLLDHPSEFFGDGRILGGWSSTDATPLWGIFADDEHNHAVESGGGRYVWISGTSMASPHAAGVAALIRDRYPNMPPSAVAALLRSSATPLSCPTDWPADDPRHCTGGIGHTSFFGAGMVNALDAVTP